MKKSVIVFIILIALAVSGFSYFQLTGKAVEEFKHEMIGPSAEKIQCMESCIVAGCEQGDDECVAANRDKCMQECGMESEPEPADEGEACMQECVARGCEERDFECQNKNMKKCEDECNMIGEPEAQSEEEQCIRDCINKIDPNIQCSAGTFEGEGETGNAVCQKCADECAHLYSGPCLTDEEWTEKENACIAQCEHCYGEPVMGPSGQGYECTVDIKCADASGEFGDDAGEGEDSFEKGHEGPGIGQEGYVATNVVAGAMDNVIKFFKGIFGGGDKKEKLEENFDEEIKESASEETKENKDKNEIKNNFGE